jgi:hypothetical protein
MLAPYLLIIFRCFSRFIALQTASSAAGLGCNPFENGDIYLIEACREPLRRSRQPSSI